MNYKKHYEMLIERGKNRSIDTYTETHHIIPKCMGGTNDINNLVKLTPEEHYVAHQLLVKIYPESIQLVGAAMMMTRHTTNNRMNNKLFGWLKRRASMLTINIPKSEETRIRMRKPKSETHKENISSAQLKNGGNGPKCHSNETKEKIKKWTDENTAFRKQVTCTVCGKSGGQGPMKRWHFDNCKRKKYE